MPSWSQWWPRASRRLDEGWALLISLGSGHLQLCWPSSARPLPTSSKATLLTESCPDALGNCVSCLSFHMCRHKNVHSPLVPAAYVIIFFFILNVEEKCIAHHAPSVFRKGGFCPSLISAGLSFWKVNRGRSSLQPCLVPSCWGRWIRRDSDRASQEPLLCCVLGNSGSGNVHVSPLQLVWRMGINFPCSPSNAIRLPPGLQLAQRGLL